MTRPSSTREVSNVAMRARPFIFRLTVAAAGAACLALWSSWRGAARRSALAELRLKLTRKRLRTAEAELQEADEYLAATGELLECYEEEFGPLPVNPFARPAAGDGAREEWPEELREES